METQAVTGANAVLSDYFEEMMVVAFSSFAAVEAFCNNTIVEKPTGKISPRRGKGHELLSAEDVERNVGTKQKRGRIVPDL